MSKAHGVYIVKFTTVFYQARTLSPDELGSNASGWTIEGDVRHGSISWVNDFKATHPSYGWVEGNYENEVVASSKRAFEDFYEKHPPSKWKYYLNT